MIEPITHRIETFLTTAGGCAFRFQGRRGLFLDDGFKSGVVVAVMDQGGVEESNISCEAQGTVCITMLVIVLVVVTVVGVVFA